MMKFIKNANKNRNNPIAKIVVRCYNIIYITMRMYLGGVRLLNILLVESEALESSVFSLLDWRKNGVGTYKVISSVSALIPNVHCDTDFVIADISIVDGENSNLAQQIQEKRHGAKLFLVGKCEDRNKIIEILKNGDVIYEPDVIKAPKKIAEIFAQMAEQKSKECEIELLLHDVNMKKKIRQAIEKGDSRFIQNVFNYIDKILPVSLWLVKEYYAFLMENVLEFAEEKGIKHIEKKEAVSALVELMDYESIKSYSVKKITGIIHLIEVNKKNQNRMVTEYIKDYINDNYMKQGTNAGNIAERFGSSGSYIGALFREQEKTTITKYITQLRVAKAAELLADTNLQIGTISMKVGYSDQNYFARIFKKNTGLSPVEYRSKSLKK